MHAALLLALAGAGVQGPPTARAPLHARLAATGAAPPGVLPGDEAASAAVDAAEAPLDAPAPRRRPRVAASAPAGEQPAEPHTSAARGLARAPLPVADELDPRSVGEFRLALMMEAQRMLRRRPGAPGSGAAGRTQLELGFEVDGALAHALVRASSGDARRDAQALALLRDAAARTPVPAALLRREFAVAVTVAFEPGGTP